MTIQELIDKGFPLDKEIKVRIDILRDNHSNSILETECNTVYVATTCQDEKQVVFTGHIFE